MKAVNEDMNVDERHERHERQRRGTLVHIIRNQYWYLVLTNQHQCQCQFAYLPICLLAYLPACLFASSYSMSYIQ